MPEGGSSAPAFSASLAQASQCTTKQEYTQQDTLHGPNHMQPLDALQVAACWCSAARPEGGSRSPASCLGRLLAAERCSASISRRALTPSNWDGPAQNTRPSPPWTLPLRDLLSTLREARIACQLLVPLARGRMVLGRNIQLHPVYCMREVALIVFCTALAALGVAPIALCAFRVACQLLHPPCLPGGSPPRYRRALLSAYAK